jgi:hypothetical protein
VLTQTVKLVSEITNVAAMMVTDPTGNFDLIPEIRRISDSTVLPSIGVFNAGYNNIIIESIVSDRVGYLNDDDYGKEAANITLDILEGVTAKPLCFNARPGLGFTGERCAAYYNEITANVINPVTGVACSANSAVSEIVALLNKGGGVNAVWAPMDCCAVVAEAASTVRNKTQQTIVVLQLRMINRHYHHHVARLTLSRSNRLRCKPTRQHRGPPFRWCSGKRARMVDWDSSFRRLVHSSPRPPIARKQAEQHPGEVRMRRSKSQTSGARRSQISTLTSHNEPHPIRVCLSI